MRLTSFNGALLLATVIGLAASRPVLSFATTSKLTTSNANVSQDRSPRLRFQMVATSYDEDVNALSSFGTRQYWDDVYTGMGDFPSEEYSWYCNYDAIRNFVRQAIPNKDATILLPGIGNDPILLDLHKHGYTNLVAFDYSQHAIDRQHDLLNYQPRRVEVELHQMDARTLEPEWTNRFDAILEKGALDAIYLSGDGNVEAAVAELDRVVKPGGAIVSVSGVVPAELRKQLFSNYEWVRDGTDDLQAGCFIFRKPMD